MMKNFVFGCASVLLMSGSGVTALPDGQRVEVLVTGNNGKKNKDKNAVQRTKLGKKDDLSTWSKRGMTKRDPIISKTDDYIKKRQVSVMSQPLGINYYCSGILWSLT